MNERFSQIRVDYQPGFTATLETYPVTPSLPEFACAIEAICSWSLGELGQMAIDRIGYSNTDGGVGVTYPDDLEDYDREVDGILIPEGFLQVRSNWGGVGHLICGDGIPGNTRSNTCSQRSRHRC